MPNVRFLDHMLSIDQILFTSLLPSLRLRSGSQQHI